MLPNLETIVHQTGYYGPIAVLCIAVFLLVETLFLLWSRRQNQAGTINRRSRVNSQAASQQQALIQLRRMRGLTADGNFQVALTAFNRLIMQSGVSISPRQFYLVMALLGIAAALLTFVFTSEWPLSILGGGLAGIGLPIAFLKLRKSQRLKKFEEQLPEAIDIIVRGLKAGHPLTVAVALVAQEMPDPIGSEFGLASDEMTYGLSLDDAMANLRARAGQSDLSFLVVAISIQSKTGGNLAEILTNLSTMIRARAKMRRKVHSLSAEGRFSMIALSIIPSLLLAFIYWNSPGYYLDVKDDPMFMPAVYIGATLWVTGVFMMRRMVNFKF